LITTLETKGLTPDCNDLDNDECVMTGIDLSTYRVKQDITRDRLRDYKSRIRDQIKDRRELDSSVVILGIR